MLSTRLAAFAALAIFPVFAQSNAVGPSTDQIAPHQHGPIRDFSDRHDGTATSTNWSGYAVTGSNFTSAQASWIVPIATCASGNQYAAFWVGLDGYSSSTVEQTGTDSDCVGKKPKYYAWYEFYPQPSFRIAAFPVKAGDVMFAQVSYSGSLFTVTITDQTTGQSYSKSAAVSGAVRSSAEWIAEAPCCTARGGILPLANFGTVLFGTDSTSVAGTNNATSDATSGPLGAYSAASIHQIMMARKTGVQKAVTSALSTDGTSFSVGWLSK